MYSVTHINSGRIVIERRQYKHNNANAVQRIIRTVFTESNVLVATAAIFTLILILRDF